MDSRRAREILASYRHGTRDAHDPLYAEALAQARRDPALARWLLQQQGLDAALRQKFSEIPIPAALKQDILAQQPAPAPVSPRVWPWRPIGVGFLIATAVAVWTVRIWWTPSKPPDFESYRVKMTSLVAGEYKMSFISKDLARVRDYFRQHHGHGDFVVPAALQALSPEGCIVMDWNGKKVSIICFDCGDDPDVFLFVTDQTAVDGSPICAEFGETPVMATAGWSTGGKTYLLASKGDSSRLHKFL